MIKIEEVPSDDIVYKVITSDLLPETSFYILDGKVEVVVELAYNASWNSASVEELKAELLALEEALDTEV